MLAPSIHRQRVSIEFISEKNLYDRQYVEELIENFLYDLCGTLRMTMLVKPVVVHCDDGSSAYVMWEESGAHLHSWYKEKFTSVDIYSCRPFMVSDALDSIEFWFNPTKVEVI